MFNFTKDCDEVQLTRYPIHLFIFVLKFCQLLYACMRVWGCMQYFYLVNIYHTVYHSPYRVFNVGIGIFITPLTRFEILVSMLTLIMMPTYTRTWTWARRTSHWRCWMWITIWHFEHWSSRIHYFRNDIECDKNESNGFFFRRAVFEQRNRYRTFYTKKKIANLP